MKINDLLLEYSRSRSVIVVDVQPEYSGIMDGDENPVFEEIIQFVNNQTGPVLMFVNAEDQGMTGDTVQDIKVYWEDTIRGEEWDPEFKPWMLSDGITINWTSVAQLKRFNGSYIVGGGRNQCLREVELLMNAFNIKYIRIDSLVYG